MFQEFCDTVRRAFNNCDARVMIFCLDRTSTGVKETVRRRNPSQRKLRMELDKIRIGTRRGHPVFRPGVGSAAGCHRPSSTHAARPCFVFPGPAGPRLPRPAPPRGGQTRNTTREQQLAANATAAAPRATGPQQPEMRPDRSGPEMPPPHAAAAPDSKS